MKTTCKALLDWCKELLADPTVDLTESARVELRRLIRECELQLAEAAAHE